MRSSPEEKAAPAGEPTDHLQDSFGALGPVSMARLGELIWPERDIRESARGRARDRPIALWRPGCGRCRLLRDARADDPGLDRRRRRPNRRPAAHPGARRQRGHTRRRRARRTGPRRAGPSLDRLRRSLRRRRPHANAARLLAAPRRRAGGRARRERAATGRVSGRAVASDRQGERR